jgi:hypothetical protein
MPYTIGFHKFNPPYWTAQEVFNEGGSISLWLSGNTADNYQGTLPTTITKDGAGYVSAWSSSWGAAVTNAGGSSVKPYVVGGNPYITFPNNTFLNVGQEVVINPLTTSSPANNIAAFFLVVSINAAYFGYNKSWSLLASYNGSNPNYFHSFAYLQSDSTDRFWFGQRAQTATGSGQNIQSQMYSSNLIFNDKYTLITGFINNNSSTFQASSYFYNADGYGNLVSQTTNITGIPSANYGNLTATTLNTIPGGDATTLGLTSYFNCHELLLADLTYSSNLFTKVEGSMAWKYGIPLPNTHPYYSSAPLLV